MNYHSDGHLTSITYTYQFQVPLVVAYLVWCTYLLYMQANQSVECFIFIASLSIENLLKIAKKWCKHNVLFYNGKWK